MSIIIKSLSYVHPDREVLFHNLSFSLSTGQKAALVGNNGIGKSTILKIITGHLRQSEGEVSFAEAAYYIPQHLEQYNTHTISMALGVDKKLKSLHEILGGDVSSENLNCLNEDWDIEERIRAALSFWNIQHLDFSQQMMSLSGGEKTKVFLSGILIHSPKVILLDEPSNHLDLESRIVLYDFIKNNKSTILVVSHDKTLLNQLDIIFELNQNSIVMYGGNYDFYNQQKSIKSLALQSQLEEKEKTLKQTQQQAREITERRQKQEGRGKSQTKKKGLPRIVAGSMQSKAEQSSAKIKNSQADKIDGISDSLKQIREQIQEQKTLRVDLKQSDMHKGKILIDAKNINFAYNENLLWKSPLSIQIRSGDRINIEGRNGVGKTTLIKIITGVLQPSEGDLSVADFRFTYIDQDYSMIDNRLTVFEQAEKFNDRHLFEHELKILLHSHQFPREVWGRKCEALSGGEKLKLILCCISISNNTPDMLILDEPTNNLDMYSQEILTEAIRNFEGTVLVISHDRYFIDEINIDRSIKVYLF